MKLYVVPGSPNCRKAQMVAHELGTELDTEVLDMATGALQGPKLSALNPNRKVPVLQNGPFTLWESNAITQYLCDHHGETALWPRDAAARADVARWQCWELAHFGRHLGAALYERLFRPLTGQQGDEAIAQREIEAWSQYARLLEERLTSQSFVTGKAPSLADFSLVALLPLCEVGQVSLGAYPATRAWLQRIGERPSFQATHPPEAMIQALRAQR